MNSLKRITDPHWMTPQWLTNRLKQNGHLPTGEVVSIDIAETSRPGVYPLRVSYSSEAPQSVPARLIFKSVEGGMEAHFYREIATQMPAPPVPPCYDVLIDDKTEYQSVLLKDVSDTHFLAILPWWTEQRKENERRARIKKDLPSKEIAKASFEAIIDEYLKFQIYWWEHPRFRGAELYIHPDFDKVERELPKFFDQFVGQIPKEWQRMCEESVASLRNLFTRRFSEGKALTLVHIDLHIHNILLPYNPQRHRPIIFDWLEYPYGIGLFALVHLLLTATMSTEIRKEFENLLLRRYHSGLLAAGIDHYSLEDCYYDYRLCLISAICYPLVKKVPDLLETSMYALDDWKCAELLD